MSLRLVRAALPVLAGALACLLARADSARAQVTGSITAIADVNNTALSVATLTQLTFGTLVPGTPVTVDPSSSTVAGEFELHGARNAQFSATFSLPAVLRAGTGGPTMPIAFGPGAGCHYSRDQQNRCAAFDPSTPLVQRLRNNPPPNDSYFVWIGGTVIPSPTQAAGVYQGTITITAVYRGL